MAEAVAVSTVIRRGDLEWEDERFAIPSFSADEQMRASFARVGLLHQPWVWAKDNRCCVAVDGFKRLQWAREIGLEAVSCRVFAAGADHELLWRYRVEGKLCGPPLNVAEKAQLVAKAAAALSPPYILDRLLPALGLPARSEVVDAYCRLANAGEALLRAVAGEEVCERAALALVSWKAAERAEMVAILNELRCSASIQVELLERISEIALARDQERLTVLSEPELQAVLKDRQVHRRRKTLLLRELLTRWRFPRLSAREERFARDVKALSLPKRVRLLPPPAFEGEDWRLEIGFSSPEELRFLLEAMRSCTRSQALAAVLQGGGGPPDRPFPLSGVVKE